MDLRPIIDQEMDRIRAAISGSPTRAEIREAVEMSRKALHARLDEALNPMYSPEPAPIVLKPDDRWS